MTRPATTPRIDGPSALDRPQAVALPNPVDCVSPCRYETTPKRKQARGLVVSAAGMRRPDGGDDSEWQQQSGKRGG
jgi:hypothetical protein